MKSSGVLDIKLSLPSGVKIKMINNIIMPMYRTLNGTGGRVCVCTRACAITENTWHVIHLVKCDFHVTGNILFPYWLPLCLQSVNHK